MLICTDAIYRISSLRFEIRTLICSILVKLKILIICKNSVSVSIFQNVTSNDSVR